MDTPDSTTLKRCTKCGETKPRQAFSVRRSVKCGLQSHCKSCQSADARSKRVARGARPYEPIPLDAKEVVCRACGITKPATTEYFPPYKSGRLRPRCRKCANKLTEAWNSAHHEYILEAGREWYKENKVSHLENSRRWREKNRDRTAIMYKQWREKNRARVEQNQRNWRLNNHEKRKVTAYRRRARKLSLPDAFSATDWQYAIDHFGGCCAVCGRPPGLWHTLAADHWIPLTSPDCPGTVVWNMVPLCHGNDGCNNSKFNRLASEWLIDKFGTRKGRAILRKIEAFLDSRRSAS